MIRRGNLRTVGFLTALSLLFLFPATALSDIVPSPPNVTIEEGIYGSVEIELTDSEGGALVFNAVSLSGVIPGVDVEKVPGKNTIVLKTTPNTPPGTYEPRIQIDGVSIGGVQRGNVSFSYKLTIAALYPLTVVNGADNVGTGSYVPAEDIRSYEQAIVIHCKEWANVREGPGTNTAIVGRVYLGEQISLLEWNADETWCKIFYDGDSKLGWLYYKFIKPIK